MDRIREAMLLFRPDLRTQERESAEFAEVEAMLACSAIESAVLALIGEGEVFTWSRGLGGNCMATLVMPDGSEEVICEAATISLALLMAMCRNCYCDWSAGRNTKRRNLQSRRGFVCIEQGAALSKWTPRCSIGLPL